MKDRIHDDLDFAGNAGKGVSGAQATHQGPRGGAAPRVEEAPPDGRIR
jgi:hypothetical protein